MNYPTSRDHISFLLKKLLFFEIPPSHCLGIHLFSTTLDIYVTVNNKKRVSYFFIFHHQDHEAIWKISFLLHPDR
jgi:hypothetical protein